MIVITSFDRIMLESLGKAFLEYVLAVDLPSIQKRIEGIGKLTSKQEAVLNELILLLRHILGSYKNIDEWNLEWVHIFGEYQPKTKMSLAAEFRLRAGGDVSLNKGINNDKVLSILATLARDAYPLLLLSEQSDQRLSLLHELNLNFYRNPVREEFDNAVMNDQDLLKLFPKRDSSTGPHGFIMQSTGGGGGLQLKMLAKIIIQNSWAWTKIVKDNPTQDQLIATLDEQLQIIRKAARYEAANVPVMIGLTGILLPPNARLDLGWGILRPINPRDEKPISGLIKGRVEHTDQKGNTVSMKYSGDIVFETTIPYRLKQASENRIDEWPTDLHEFENIERKLENLRLGLLLSGDTLKHKSNVLVSSWWLIFDPLSFGYSLSWSDPSINQHLQPRQLTKSEGKTWKDWSLKIHKGRVESIDIAVRRILRASSERNDHADVLVDAVTAWENLVGSGQGEVTLRVSSALSWLLESEPNKRLNLQTSLSKIYNLRSKIVHGSKIIGVKEIDQTNEALYVAINALKILFATRRELLTECKDANERSLRLIMGS